MKQEFIELAGRIRELREVCGYSLERMAKEIGIEPAVLAGYEQNGEDIPISVIYEIANICKVEFTDILTGQEAKLDTYHIVRRGKGKPIDRHSGYRFEDLAYRYGHKICLVHGLQHFLTKHILRKATIRQQSCTYWAALKVIPGLK